MSGGIIFQTISGLLLSISSTPSNSDPSNPDSPTTREDPDSTLFFLLTASLVQLGVVSGFWGLMRRRGLDPPPSLNTDGKTPVGSRAASLRMRVSTERLRRSSSAEEGEYGLLRETSRDRGSSAEENDSEGNEGSDEEDEEAGTDGIGIEELKRGKKFLILAGCTVVSSWLAFILNLLL